MAKPQWTDEQVFAQLNSGRHWTGSTITYTFPQVRGEIHFEQGEGASFTPLSAEQQSYARLALATWNDLIAPNIVPGAVGRSDLEFGNTNWLEHPGYAHAYYPPLGSIWFTSLYEDLQHPQLNDHGFSTYIHEIGHALGLNHMGNYNGGDDDGPSSFQDSTVLSVMSYYGPELMRGMGEVMWGDWVGNNGYVGATQTPMLNDIMAIQRIYGAAVTRADDTVYGFGSNVTGDTAILYDFTRNDSPILTLYDSGGNDTLNLSGWGTDSDVDLRPGHYSAVNGMTNNLGIARGVIIENAVGGAGNDTFHGNEANNLLDGGAGQDRAFFAGAFTHYTLDYDISARQYTVHDATGAEGTDTLRNIEYASFANFGGELNDLTPGVHRFFNSQTGTHFYTSNNDEATAVSQLGGFQYEGTDFARNVMPDGNSVSVHRFYNGNTGSHFYTADSDEAAHLVRTGVLAYEGVGFSAYREKAADTIEVHRFYNTSTGSHFYTADAAEMEHVKLELAGSFNYEGVAFYAQAA